MAYSDDSPIKFHVSGIDFYGYFFHNDRREVAEVTFYSLDPISKLIRHRIDMEVTYKELENAGKSVDEMFNTDKKRQEYVFCWLISDIVSPIYLKPNEGFQGLFMEKEAKKIIVDWIGSLK